MITVSEQPFDISAMTREYPANSIENQLLHMMASSLDIYQYNSPSTLKLELNLRKEIVNAATELNDSGLSFAVFHKSRCNHRYWSRTNEGGFVLNAGAAPARAINDIFINGGEYATECATAIMIVYYKALLTVFGEDLFNQEFPRIYLYSWESEPILGDMVVKDHVSTILIGDGAYFENPDYNPETPQWQGENVIALPNSMYYGHGIGIASAGDIIAALNAERRYGATEPAYLSHSVNRLDYQKLSGMYAVPTSAPASPPEPEPSLLVWSPFPAPITRG